MLENIIKNIKYSTIGLSAMTAYLFPNLRNQCFGIIIIILYNHIVSKICKYIKFNNIFYNSLIINFVFINKICCLKYISNNIPIIKFEKYNYPFRISYEILNLFWKSYSSIIYGTYVISSVCFLSSYILYFPLKNYISNIIRENQNSITERYVPILNSIANNIISQINIDTSENIRLVKENFDILCPIRCAGLNNISNTNMDECCICKEKYNDRELHRVLPCNHSYHAHCIEDWIIRNKKCPLCRYELQI